MKEYCKYCVDWVDNGCIHRKEAVGPPNCFYVDTIRLVTDLVLLQKKVQKLEDS